MVFTFVPRLLSAALTETIIWSVSCKEADTCAIHTCSHSQPVSRDDQVEVRRVLVGKVAQEADEGGPDHLRLVVGDRRRGVREEGAQGRVERGGSQSPPSH